MNLDRLQKLVTQLQGALGGNRIIVGSIAANGTTLAGSGFSVVYNGTGDYTVTFDMPFGSRPVVTFGLGFTASRVGVKHKDGVAPTATGFSVYTYSSASLADSAFDFTAIGPT